jgi:hypothetical protein
VANIVNIRPVPDINCDGLEKGASSPKEAPWPLVKTLPAEDPRVNSILTHIETCSGYSYIIWSRVAHKNIHRIMNGG